MSSAEVGELGQRVMMALAAWEKDCSDPDMLAMYVSPVVDRQYTDVRDDPEWRATLEEWEACGADEAYLPDFVLAYAKVATGAVAVG